VLQNGYRESPLQVREAAISNLESSSVTYTSDVLKCTVVKVEGLQMSARGKPCVVEVSYGPTMRYTERQTASKEHGNAECAYALTYTSCSLFVALECELLATGPVKQPACT
jgi:hypothetical protein